MPNTLVHLGVQGGLTRPFLTDADLKWVYLGCVIPDVPWIIQRLGLWLPLEINPYDLRLYCIVQASLLLCLVLSSALALLSLRIGRTFVVLGVNSFLHLLLDACQYKWSNGVHLWAPFSWRLFHLDLLATESWLIYGLTFFGLVFALVLGRRSLQPGPSAPRLSIGRMLGCTAATALYLVLPLVLVNGPLRADNHYVATLRAVSQRPGKPIVFDRVPYTPTPAGGHLTVFGETFRLQGFSRPRPATVSVRGVFETEDRIRVTAAHVHLPYFRQWATYLGLGLVAIVWIGQAIGRRQPTL